MMIAGTESYVLHDHLSDRVKETKTWRNQFQREAQARAQSAINSTIGKLRRETYAFAEEHCEDEGINRAWQQKVESAGINEQIRELQAQLQREAREKINTLVEEIGYELKSVQTAFARTNTETEPIRDHKKVWNWSVTGVSAILGLAATAIFFTPLALPTAPLWIAAGAVSLIGRLTSRLFGNKAKRRQEAVSRIRPELEESLNRIESQLKRDLDKLIRMDLIDTQINGTINTLETTADSARQAAKFYRNQAETLRGKVIDMNREMVRDALNHAGEDGCTLDWATVARAPGQGTAVKPENNMGLTNDDIMKVQAIIQEPVETILPHWSDRRVVPVGRRLGGGRRRDTASTGTGGWRRSNTPISLLKHRQGPPWQSN